MNVRELIEKLATLDPESPVVVWDGADYDPCLREATHITEVTSSSPMVQMMVGAHSRIVVQIE